MHFGKRHRRVAIKELIPNNLGALKGIFSSLRSRNYRLYFIGQCISVTGSWMQSIAMSWLIYRLSGSVVLLATINVITQLPSFFISPFAGVLLDRINRKRMLIITQCCFMLEAATLAVLMFTGSIQVWHILLLGLFVGVINAIDSPTRQSMVMDLVDRKEDLSNAIALNSAVFNGARLVGPSLGGLLVGGFGEAWCFLINAVSYIAVIVAITKMTLQYNVKEKQAFRILEQLKEGAHYAFGYLPIRTLLLMIGAISFFGMPFLVVVPAYVREVLHGSSETLGFLMSSFGAGALLAAIYMAARKSVLGLGKVLTLCCALFGIGLPAIAYVQWTWLALIIAFPAGFGLIAAMASINTLLQTLSDEDKRGRVMSFYSMALIGMAPLGSMLFSAVEKLCGLSLSIVCFGLVCFAAAAAFEHYRPLVRRLSRPAYVRKSRLVPEIASGIQSTEARPIR